MRKIILLSSVVLFLSCKNKATDTSSKEKNSDSIKIENLKSIEKINDSVKTKSFKNCNETFEIFFERFSRDNLFQKSRIKYPLEESYIENLETSEIKVDIINNASEYKFLDFSEDKNAINKEFDKYQVIVDKIDEENVHYKNDGIDNGINVIYKFKLIEGCWYMVEIEDKST